MTIRQVDLRPIPRNPPRGLPVDRAAAVVDADWVRIAVDHAGRITAEADGHRLVTLQIADAGDGVHLCLSPVRVIVVGERTPDIWTADARSRDWRWVGAIARLRFDGYDTGGMQRVKYFEVASEPDAVVIETELAIALVSSGQLRWLFDHQEFSTHVTAVSARSIYCVSNGGHFTINLDTGATRPFG